ncbi:kinesin-like protein Klp10A [Copidosoma floridanum]|uniref:kinesin-like protein Klp10A n=1 Tax=Copidosoma floridanum TaxID=29053 RepID=UPI000C6F98E0|nr:kinesin-like protein Klp10A [Copidosoma floridanum]
MEPICKIEAGNSVNIKRTDGRVHSAIVSGVNWDQQSVTVEWFEKGETKGKEVEMDAILSLNPELNMDNILPSTHMNNQILTSTKARLCKKLTVDLAKI